MEPFIDSLDQQLDPGVRLMGAYLITLECQRNGDGDLLDLEDVVFYEPVVGSFIVDLLAMEIEPGSCGAGNAAGAERELGSTVEHRW